MAAAKSSAKESTRASAGASAMASTKARVEETCPMVEVLGRVSAKWNISILVAVSEGPIRFTELERALDGISRRMLTLNLRNLERDGLVTRTVHPVVPPKVEYEATPMARELYGSLLALTTWAERHRDDVTVARTRYDAAVAAAAEAEAEAEPS